LLTGFFLITLTNWKQTRRETKEVRMRDQTATTDPVLRDNAIRLFDEVARSKFDKGIQEHNPQGDRPLSRLTVGQLVDCARDELIDAWFYLAAIEEREEFNLKKQDADLGSHKTETR
jgi:hypothetical protein